MLVQEYLYGYLAISVGLFVIGMIGVITRKNAIVVFMCIELMLNAVNLSLVTFSRYYNDPRGFHVCFLCDVRCCCRSSSRFSYYYRFVQKQARYQYQ
ncbi:MAG: hypothetical protein KatS3mg035_0966 [Bacteroidia bacterium]|nr:MAG: hypothetical protein KatS3mg035_0966 [Bacteroidia bacterium]